MKKTSRGRPRNYDADTALQNALKLFWQKGYTATSLDNLAETTGMKRPSLYAAFGNKKSIYMKTLNYFRTDLQKQITHIMKSGNSLTKDLEDFFDVFIKIYSSDQLGCYVHNTTTVEAPNDSDIREMLLSTIAASDTMLEKRLAQAQKNGELNKDADIKALASLLNATVHSLSVRARAGIPPKKLRSFARGAVKMLVI
ncbi:MAG: TetR/AcrR family transcriptional regulator [Methyloligellaceae bacterium]